MSLDDLAQLWAGGATLAQIERATGLTKGVAIGRIHRARKAGDPRFRPRPARLKAPPKPRDSSRSMKLSVPAGRCPLRQSRGC